MANNPNRNLQFLLKVVKFEIFTWEINIFFLQIESLNVDAEMLELLDKYRITLLTCWDKVSFYLPLLPLVDPSVREILPFVADERFILYNDRFFRNIIRRENPTL